VGLVIVALLAAAMSSIDSVLNALSAASSEDLIGRWPRGAQLEARFGALPIAKALTLFWGLVIVALAFYVGDVADSVLVAINKIGSLLNGPLLALFLIAAFAPRVGEGAALRGLAAGMALNAALWLGAPGVSWLWWNVFGCLATLAVAGLSALPQVARALGAALSDRGGRTAALSLLGYSGFIGLACALGSAGLQAGIAP
jgi:Na+/proline symporter